MTRIPEDHERLKALVTVYAYACRDLNRPPEKFEDLVPILKQANVDNPREYLRSTRDGQPYEIVWGLDLEERYLGATVPVAHEREGVYGRRLLVTSDQDVRELPADELEKVEWPVGYTPKISNRE